MTTDKREKKYADVPEDTLIWHLHWCLIEQGMSIKETRYYFQNVLQLRHWTVNPYMNVHPHIVSVWCEGEQETREYHIDDLSDLKQNCCTYKAR